MKKLDEKGISTLEKLNELGKPSVETIRKMPSYHAVILAKNETGRVNLYRLISESHLKYFSRRPKLPKSLYLEYCEGLMIGSACEAGELYRAILEEKPEEEIDRLAKVYTEGYRIGFINTGKDISKKGTVDIRYSLGFERIIRKCR